MSRDGGRENHRSVIIIGASYFLSGEKVCKEPPGPSIGLRTPQTVKGGADKQIQQKDISSASPFENPIFVSSNNHAAGASLLLMREVAKIYLIFDGGRETGREHSLPQSFASQNPAPSVRGGWFVWITVFFVNRIITAAYEIQPCRELRGQADSPDTGSAPHLPG